MKRKTTKKIEIKLLICFLMISIITVGFSSFSATFSFLGDITIIGAPRTITVTFDANGGYFIDDMSSSKRLEYDKDDIYGIFPDIYYEGYTFLGFFDSDNNQVFDTSSVGTEDHTLYARWEENEPSHGYEELYVTLIPGYQGYVDGHEGESEVYYFLATSSDYDVPASMLPFANPYEGQYVFRGWYTEDGSIYIGATDPIEITYGQLNGLTLYGDWEDMSGFDPGPGFGEISITFNLDGTKFVISDDMGMETQWYEYRTDYSCMSLPTPYDPTYSQTFTGWYSEMQGGQVTDEYGIPLYGDISSLNGDVLTPLYE